MRQNLGGIDLDGAATRTIPIHFASRAMTLRDVWFTQELAADGDKTVTLRNLTDGVDLTSAVQVAGLGAGAKVQLPILAAAFVDIGFKLLGIVYTVNAAGAVHPGESAISLVYDPQLGIGNGPAWAG